MKKLLYFLLCLGAVYAYKPVAAQQASLVADINKVAVPSGIVSPMAVYQNKLYFGVNEMMFGHRLWVYDGTNPPTRAPGVRGRTRSHRTGT